MSKFFGAISLIGGGTGALDAIDGAALSDLDGAIVVTASTTYLYTLDDDSGASEDSPLVITPDSNPGTKRWILTDVIAKGAKFYETACFSAEVDNGNSGTADTIDWTKGNKQKSTLTGNCTFTFSPEPSGPCNLILKLIQDGTGGRTVTWPGDVKWPGGNAPTLSTGANDVDIICFYYDGADFYGQAALDFS